MHIRGAVKNLLNSYLEDHPIRIGIGIDVGETLVTKVGKGKDSNNVDLVWAGTSCNLASKLSDVADNKIYITEDVYEPLRDTWTFSDDGENMWSESEYRIPGFEGLRIYESGYLA